MIFGLSLPSFAILIMAAIPVYLGFSSAFKSKMRGFWTTFGLWSILIFVIKQAELDVFLNFSNFINRISAGLSGIEIGLSLSLFLLSLFMTSLIRSKAVIKPHYWLPFTITLISLFLFGIYTRI